MEKLGNFVTVKPLDATGWAKLHRGFKVDGKAKERALIYEVPLALSCPDKFPHHLAVLDVLHHEMAGGKFLFAHKYISGFPLSQVLRRCDRDGFPLPLDHALLIMERVLSAWEDYKLGLPHPFLIWMTFDGEVKCSPLPLPKAFPKWKHNELLPWLSPQLVGGAEWSRPDQVWAAGTLFFQLLTGEIFPSGASDDDRIAAILKTPAMAEGPVPKDLQMILLKALASKVEERYQHIKDMREELGQLIYSGAYTPTTFNLAFFMHTLFREESDGEEKLLQQEDALDLTPILAPPPPPKPAAPPAQLQPAGPARPAPPSFAQTSPPEPEAKRSPALFIGLAAVAVVLVVAGIFYFKGGSEPAVPQGPSPAEVQAQQALAEKLREQELKIQELEATEAKTKEEFEKLKKAQKEGEKNPEIDKEIERKKQELLDAEKRKAEIKKEMEIKKEPVPAPAPAPASTTPPPAGPATPAGANPAPTSPPAGAQPQPAPASLPAVDTAKIEPIPAAPVKPASTVKEGDLVSLSEVDSSPVPSKKVPVSYPPIAKMKKITGKVTLKVLVSEKGKPEQVEVVTISPPSNMGFDKAAIEAVRQWVFQPATKDGVRVKCWFLVPVVFE